jgi:hypothetical protein
MGSLNAREAASILERSLPHARRQESSPLQSKAHIDGPRHPDFVTISVVVLAIDIDRVS